MSDGTDIKPNPFDLFFRIYCISLKRSIKRRAHIMDEYARVGIDAYEFVDAYDKTSAEVTKLYHSDFVKKYPPCFRCGRDSCQCENKSLFRPQIGNWLSHIKVWKAIAENSPGLSLVCEDDVKFQDNIYQALGVVSQSEEISNKLETAVPVLIRFGWALCDEHTLSSAPSLRQTVRMANCCYAINAQMAKLLLSSLKGINTTSDIYVHRLIGSTVSHYTVIPPPVYELSWSTGQLLSEIRPKQRRVDYLLKKLENLDAEDAQYQVTLASYKKESSRLKQYNEFNELPTTNYEDEFDLI